LYLQEGEQVPLPVATGGTTAQLMNILHHKLVFNNYIKMVFEIFVSWIRIPDAWIPDN
jgi:hypothetical protein